MVDVAGLAAIEGSIDDVVLVESEVVAVADPKFLVGKLSFVSHRVPDLLADVFDHNVTMTQPMGTKKRSQVSLFEGSI